MPMIESQAKVVDMTTRQSQEALVSNLRKWQPVCGLVVPHACAVLGLAQKHFLLSEGRPYGRVGRAAA